MEQGRLWGIDDDESNTHYTSKKNKSASRNRSLMIKSQKKHCRPRLNIPKPKTIRRRNETLYGQSKMFSEEQCAGQEPKGYYSFGQAGIPEPLNRKKLSREIVSELKVFSTYEKNLRGALALYHGTCILTGDLASNFLHNLSDRDRVCFFAGLGEVKLPFVEIKRSLPYEEKDKILELEPFEESLIESSVSPLQNIIIEPREYRNLDKLLINDRTGFIFYMISIGSGLMPFKGNGEARLNQTENNLYKILGEPFMQELINKIKDNYSFTYQKAQMDTSAVVYGSKGVGDSKPEHPGLFYMNMALHRIDSLISRIIAKV